MTQGTLYNPDWKQGEHNSWMSRFFDQRLGKGHIESRSEIRFLAVTNVTIMAGQPTPPHNTPPRNKALLNPY